MCCTITLELLVYISWKGLLFVFVLLAVYTSGSHLKLLPFQGVLTAYSAYTLVLMSNSPYISEVLLEEVENDLNDE